MAVKNPENLISRLVEKKHLSRDSSLESYDDNVVE